MGHKSMLQELLKEEQEPFLLNKYISDRRTHMKTTTTTLVNNKQRSTTFPLNLCKNACFSTSTTTTTTKSPLLEFPSPNNNKKPIFLHIPSRTAALLLEAALRIHKHKKTNHGFGLLGSFFRRLKQNRRKQKLKVSSLKDRENVINRSYELGFRCSYSVWSESNDDESLDMETSSSTSTNFDDHHHHHIIHNGGFFESPFRFVLQKSPSSSSGLNTPELPSPPPSSPQTPHTTQDKESNGGESVHKFQSGELEEEDKEQCSPVSVLDPPFEDDDEAHGNDEEDENEEHGFDLECSYAIMQRTKQQLLYKLRRFEKLAGLDPVELEKIMLDQEEEEDETVMEDDGYVYEASEALSCKENGLIEQVFEALFESSRLQFPEGLKRLVSDVIAEEEREIECLEDYNHRDMVVRKVCKRMELWKQVESNTIDMMIEEDFTREEENGWKKKNVDQIRDMAGELELAIFGFLVEEFSEELEC
ncbi:hypothetical protein S83_055235 [Arachis hypogaea]